MSRAFEKVWRLDKIIRSCFLIKIDFHEILPILHLKNKKIIYRPQTHESQNVYIWSVEK